MKREAGDGAHALEGESSEAEMLAEDGGFGVPIKGGSLLKLERAAVEPVDEVVLVAGRAARLQMLAYHRAPPIFQGIAVFREGGNRHRHGLEARKGLDPAGSR